MSMYLTFTLGKDRRELVDDITDFKLETQDMQKVQGRQGDSLANQVFVTIKNQDGTPYNLTGCNMIFEGKLPDNVHKIYDAKHGVILNAQNGQFRFDLPKPAFAVAGSYVQAFFRIMRNGDSVALLEFDLTVLADLVITDEIPRNYLTPFEDKFTELSDLIEKGGKDFEAAMAQWKADFAKLVVEMTSTTDGINLTISEIKTQLGILEDKIKADGLLTQAEFDKQMASLLDEVNDKLSILSTPIYVEQTIYGEPVEEQDAKIKQDLDSLTVGIDPDKFNFVFITDNHYAVSDDNAELATNFGVNHVNRALYLDQYVDMMILGGDNIDGYHDGLDGLLADQKQIATDFLFGSPNHSDKFGLKGNHDDGSQRQTDFIAGTRPNLTKMPGIISDAKFKRDYHTADLIFNEQRKGDSNYFYKDYPGKKVRVIGLDSNDNPGTLADDGSEKYPEIWHMGYMQEQINWLANVALKNVPEDYTTLIVAHMQSWVKNGTNIHNADLVNQVVSNFVQGQAGTVSSADTDWEVNVPTDFTTQGPRLLAGWIHGHEHAENIRTDGGYNNIGIIASINPLSVTDFKGDNDGWNLIELDTEKRTLTLKGFGTATDRKFSY